MRIPKNWPNSRGRAPHVRDPDTATSSIQAKVELGPTKFSKRALLAIGYPPLAIGYWLCEAKRRLRLGGCGMGGDDFPPLSELLDDQG